LPDYCSECRPDIFPDVYSIILPYLATVQVSLITTVSPGRNEHKVHHVDTRTGGTYRMLFINFSNGQTHTFGGKYLELENSGETILNTKGGQAAAF
jgi:hypothetical protein